MKILVVSDTWWPQVNGVARTLSNVTECLASFGHRVSTITPGQFWTVPHPAYPRIRLAINTWPRLGRMVDSLMPDQIYIATEGPLGMAARRYCLRRRLHFTTSFTTNFPKYGWLRFRIPKEWTFAWLRWFHSPADNVLVATPSLREELALRGFQNLRIWTRGVDPDIFRPQDTQIFDSFERPVWLYVGRIAAEKNLEDFLSLTIGGTKVLVGDGPELGRLRKKYPGALFVGEKHGEELAQYYPGSDVLVFPSRTDTFGIVMIEALASGTPVAAYPVTGPVDVITSDQVGILSDDLGSAALRALSLDGILCREFALGYTWQDCARILEQALVRNRWN